MNLSNLGVGMYRDYLNVLEYFGKLDSYTLRIFGKHLCELDYTGDSAPIYVLKTSDFFDRYQEFSKSFGVLQQEPKQKATLDDKIARFAAQPDKAKRCELFKSPKNIAQDEKTACLIQKFFRNLSIQHKVKELSDDDMLNILTLLSIKQVESYIIVRYNEIGYFNNKTVIGDVFDAYDGLLQECRSIIIDIRDFSIVSLPFYKFRNMGETAGVDSLYSVDSIMKRLQTAKKIEYADKIDGSFIQITSLGKKRINGKPYVLASSGNLDEKISPVLTYARHYYEGNKSYSNLVSDFPDYTFIFELVDRRDRHTVTYKRNQEGLYLIGGRNKISGDILYYEDIIKLANKYNLATTVLYKTTFDNIVESLSKFKAYEKEGYVINIDGFLVKLKCDDYLSVSKLYNIKSSFSVVIELYVAKRIDDLYPKLPENYQTMIKEYLTEITTYENLIRSYVESQVQFMLNSPEINVRNATKYIETLPKTYRGYVSNLYFNRIKGIEAENFYLLSSNRKPIENSYKCINGKELRRRVTDLKKIFAGEK